MSLPLLLLCQAQDLYAAESETRPDHRFLPSTQLHVHSAGDKVLEWSAGYSGSGSTLSTDAVFLMGYAFQMGAGHGLQVGVSLWTAHRGTDTSLDSERLELRYAPRDWGKLWGNPTVTLNLISPGHGQTVGELGLVLGGDVAGRWRAGGQLHFGREITANLVGVRLRQFYSGSAGIAYSFYSGRLALGLEAALEANDKEGNRLDFDSGAWFLGPAVHWRLSQWLVMDFAIQGGTRYASDDEYSTLAVGRCNLVLGVDF